MKNIQILTGKKNIYKMFFLKEKLLSTRFRKLNGRYNISISTYFYAALPSRVEFSMKGLGPYTTR